MADEKIHIVHISDLQAGANCLADDESIPDLEGMKRLERYAQYARILGADARDVVAAADEDSRVDLLVVSGDIADTASRREYEAAGVFLEALVSALGMSDWRNVVIVPGNHDVDWVSLKKAWGRKRLQTREQIEECGARRVKMTRFTRWVNGRYRANGASYEYRFQQPIRFSELTRPELAVVGLDSCERCVFEREPQHDGEGLRASINGGHIGGRQLSAAIDFLGKPTASKVKIAVMHHNPFPHQDGDDGVDNVDQVRTALADNGTTLILAGHMHQARYDIWSDPIANTERRCYTLITGPCCMLPGERTFYVGKHKERYPNRYQVLSVDPVLYTVEIHLRRLSFERRSGETGTRGGWTSDTDPAYASSFGESFVLLDPTDERAIEVFRKRFHEQHMPFRDWNDDPR